MSKNWSASADRTAISAIRELYTIPLDDGPKWYGRRDSNSDRRFRKPMPYPLDDAHNGVAGGA